MAAAGQSVGVCTCLQCQQKGGGSIREAFEKEIIAHGLAGKVDVEAWDCGGLCGLGPVVGVPQEGVVYCNLKPADAAKIVKEHLAGGTPVERLRYKGPGAADSIPMESEHPFFKNQVFLVLRNCGLIDPEKIDEYIARDGYSALAKALREMTPERSIEEMLDLRPARPRRGGLPDGDEVEVRGRRRSPTSSTSSATPTRATRARSWTAPCSRATRTRCSRG